MEESPAKLTWQSCAKWLCALDILPSNHKVMMPDATLRDLAYTLRDGVLLCNIVTGKSLLKQKKLLISMGDFIAILAKKSDF